MTEPLRPEQPKPQPAAGENHAPVNPPAAEAALPDPKPLTVEEQMALYEKHLKENDWGHQPC